MPTISIAPQPPRRVQNWYSTWQALDFRPACPQNLKYVGTSNGIRNGVHEDCLYLNIYTPTVGSSVANAFPVMFYIHGGDFEHGASNLFPGHMLAGWGEVVVVTINYRLGALGFLSTGDENSPGNYGLLDMSMALEWVYRNIRLFNGDRERITVFGPGAGGAAAGLLAVLPKTRYYVRQFISSSGSPLADWAAIDDIYRVQNTSRVYGLEVGCTVESSYKLLQCLNRRNYEELASAPITPDVGTFAWSPVVDRNFTLPGDDWYEDWKEEDWRAMPENPIKMIWANLHHPELQCMAGVNRDEAANMVYEDPRLTSSNHEVTEEFFDLRIKEWVKRYNYSLNPEGAFDAIKWMYTFWPDPHNTTQIRDQYVDMLSDALYKSGIDQLIKEMVNTTDRKPVPTYYYLLNTTLDALKLPQWREVPGNLEYYFLSGAPFMDPEFYPENYRISRNLFSEGDRNISQFMMKTFANFAKWGNPTQVQVSVLNAKWDPVVYGTLRYLSINNTFNTTMHFNYRQPQNTFWYHYIPLVVREWIPTPIPPRNPWTDMTEPVTAALYSFVAITALLLVVLCVCFGLWKSANRQRNKALDDLQYYSTDNLAEERDLYDEGVRKYLERLPSTKSNGGTEMTRSTTPMTLITNADTNQRIDDSRSVSPTGRLTSGLTEPDARSQASFRSAKTANGFGNASGSPYSNRKSYHEIMADQPLRAGTPSSVAQYSDGVYIGTTHSSSGRTPSGTLERPKHKNYKPVSQPTMNQPYEVTEARNPNNVNQYVPDYTSAPNVAYNTNKSSTSSEISSRSNQPLQPQYQLQYQPIQQPIFLNQQSVNSAPQQPQQIPQYYQQMVDHVLPAVSRHEMATLPQQPLQHLLTSVSQAPQYTGSSNPSVSQNEVGIPLQPIEVYATAPVPSSQSTIPQPAHVASQPIQTVPQQSSGVSTVITDQQFKSEPFPQQQQHLPQQHQIPSQQLETFLQQPYAQLQQQDAQQHPAQTIPTQSQIPHNQPQPLPRSSVPQENAKDPTGSQPSTISRSRPNTPSSMTFEIIMKNGKGVHTIPPKVMNTEL
ncbi:Carboxylesterase type B [Trinorchestia longiramus]|nr:Carboxylesterase type B [Trinorchestia longiramus]